MIQINDYFYRSIITACTLIMFSSNGYALDKIAPTDMKYSARLPLDTVIREVIRRNSTILSDFLQSKISNEAIKGEKGIYDPSLQSTFNNQNISKQNTTDEMVVRNATNYYAYINQFDVGVSGIIPTGAQWDVKFLNTQTNDTTIETTRSYLYEFAGDLKLSVTQPILKGFGKKNTEARIDLATIQGNVDFGKFEQKVLDLLGTTIQIYWRLYGTQKIYETWLNSVRIAEQSIADLEYMFTLGKISEPELLEARSSFLQRRSELYSARNRLVEIHTQLYTLLSIPYNYGTELKLFELDNPDTEKTSFFDVKYYQQAALEKWPEYQNAKRLVEKERLQVAFAENQLLPQFDLLGSVGTNSMGSQYNQSFRYLLDSTYLSWSVGMKFSMPLWGDASNSALVMAKLRLQQAEAERDNLEKSLSNSIVSKLDSATSMKDQLKELSMGVEVRSKLLAIEIEKLKAGKVSHKSLLTQEEEFVNFQRKFLSGVVGFKSSAAILEISSSDILQKYGIDVKKYVPLPVDSKETTTLF